MNDERYVKNLCIDNIIPILKLAYFNILQKPALNAQRKV